MSVWKKSLGETLILGVKPSVLPITIFVHVEGKIRWNLSRKFLTIQRQCECFFNYLKFLWFVPYLSPTSLVQSGAEPQVFDFDESRRHPVDFSPVKVWLWVLVVEVYSGRFMGHVHHVLPEFPEVEQVWSLTHLLHFLAISFFGGVHNQEA